MLKFKLKIINYELYNRRLKASNNLFGNIIYKLQHQTKTLLHHLFYIISQFLHILNTQSDKNTHIYSYIRLFDNRRNSNSGISPSECVRWGSSWFFSPLYWPVIWPGGPSDLPPIPIKKIPKLPKFHGIIPISPRWFNSSIHFCTLIS